MLKIIISPAKKMNETDILPPEGAKGFPFYPPWVILNETARGLFHL